MNIERINTYQDTRFSQTALNQHGCFLADGEPYEIEILSSREAVIRGREEGVYPEIIEEFRFFTPHITMFYSENHTIIQEFPPAEFLTVSLKDIQPSQFYVDKDKIAAIESFIRSGMDIVIQVCKKEDRFISLDGHTRLYYAVQMGWTEVRAVEASSGAYINEFVEEAIRRNIRSPYDLQLISHKEYEEKWNKFCDNYFAQTEKTE